MQLDFPGRYIYYNGQPEGDYISYKPLVKNQGPLVGTKVTGKCT
jgi:hypothetical protein